VFRGLLKNPVSSGLGRLCEAVIWRTRAGSSLPWPVHAPRRDLQSPIDFLRWQHRHVSLEGLRSRQQTAQNDRFSRGVHPTFSPARRAEGFCSHSPFWVHGELPTIPIARVVPETFRHDAGGPANRNRFNQSDLVVLTLSGTHDRDRSAHSGSDHVEIPFEMFLRYIVGPIPMDPLDVQRHVYAEVYSMGDTLPIPRRRIGPQSPNSHAHHPYTHLRQRSSALDASHHVTTSTRIPLLSP